MIGIILLVNYASSCKNRSNSVPVSVFTTTFQFRTVSFRRFEWILSTARAPGPSMGKCHYLIFCTITPDRVRLCFSISIKSDTNITTLARRAFWSLATP